jgi:hypothetical protein
MYFQDLISTPSDVAVALNGLSHFLTPDLARDLAPEVIPMLNHSRAHIRKRAILLLFKVLLKYPEASSSSLTRLREKLDDPDPGKRFLVAYPPNIQATSQASLRQLSMSCASWVVEIPKTTLHLRLLYFIC